MNVFRAGEGKVCPVGSTTRSNAEGLSTPGSASWSAESNWTLMPASSRILPIVCGRDLAPRTGISGSLSTATIPPGFVAGNGCFAGWAACGSAAVLATCRGDREPIDRATSSGNRCVYLITGTPSEPA